jgi:hypothetical protein
MLLQLRDVSRAARERLAVEGGDVDAAHARLLDLRREVARERGGLSWLAERLDRAVHTHAPELLDRDDVPVARRVAVVRKLHTFNARLFSYHRFFHALEPTVRRAAPGGRPVRLLELAAGSGEFSLQVERLARRRGLAVQATGSDVVPEYVAGANREARRRSVGARFVELDAFTMAGVEPGAYDVAFIAQSVHHFSPGQMAAMIRAARRVCTTGFVAVDGQRSLALLGLLPVVGLALSRDFAHDSFVSARKFYSEAELDLIAELAAPGAVRRVRSHHPGFSVLTVDFD